MRKGHRRSGNGTQTGPAGNPDTKDNNAMQLQGGTLPSMPADISMDKYRILFNNTTQGVFYQRSDGSLFDVNPAALKMLGLSEDQFKGRSSYDPRWKVVSETGDVLLPEQHPSMVSLLTGKPVRNMVFGVFNPERNDFVWVRGNATPDFRQGEGMPYQVCVTIDDITDLKHASMSLAENEEKFRELFTHMPAATVIYEAVDNGEDFVIKDFNSSAEKIEQLKKSELIGKRVTHAFPGVKEFGLFAVFQNVWKTGQAQHFPAAMYQDERDPGTWRENWVYKLKTGEIIAIYLDITERVLAVASLEKVNTFLNETQSLSRVGGWEYNVATGKITWTEEVYHIHGVGRDFNPGNIEQDISFYSSQDARVIKEAFQRAVELGEPYDLEIKLNQAGGTTIWVRTIGKPRLEGGRVTSVIGYIMDITDHKTAQDILRESEERFSNAFGYAAIGMALVSLEGRWLKVNKSLCEIVGYSDEELQAMTFQDITHPDDLNTDLQYVKSMIAGEIRTYQMEKRYFHKSGEIIWALLSVSLVRNSQGTPLYFISQIENITKRKLAEETLRDLVAYNRNLIEVSLDPLVTISPEGKIGDVNVATETATGFSRDELIGKDFSDYFTDPQKAREGYMHVFSTGKVTDYPLEIRHRNGQTIPVLYNATVYRDNTGSVRGVFAAARDISGRKHNEYVLSLSNRIFSAANRHNEIKPFLDEVVFTIQDYTACEAVGIRLLDEKGNIPYPSYTGFSASFYELESPLNIRSDECMCIYVIRGDANPGLPVITPNGSFYCNGTTRFLAGVSDEDKGRTRNVCNAVGYESVALVAIKRGDVILGLIHLADHRENMVPLSTVTVIEEIAGPLGATIQRIKAEKQVRDSLAEKEVLLREIHHRVKNNLTRIISLIGLQIAQLSDTEDITGLRDLESRIRSMSLVHESLYHSRSLSSINAQAYTEDLVQHLVQSYGPRNDIRWNIMMNGTIIPLDIAVNCGLILTEIITNSIKYAFPEGWSCREKRNEDCEISLSMEEKDGFIILCASDNGRGIPPGTITPGTRSLGLSLIRILVKNQLQGELKIDTTRGTSYVIRFAREPYREGEPYAE